MRDTVGVVQVKLSEILLRSERNIKKLLYMELGNP